MDKAINSIKDITTDYMKQYIEKNDPQGKAAFIEHAFVPAIDKEGNPKYEKNGEPKLKYNHFRATRYFCRKYKEELLPKKKSKKADIFNDWK